MNQAPLKNSHIPVLASEILRSYQQFRKQNPGKMLVIDTTLGSGGHAAALISEERTVGSGETSFILLDLDPQAIEHLKNRIDIEKSEVNFQVQNFRHCPQGLGYVQGKSYFILADLGLSQNQLDAGRGFSYKKHASLDMRLDEGLAVTAADLLSALPVRQLAKIFGEYGQLVRAEELAKLIVHSRNTGFKIATTTDFNQLMAALKLDSPKYLAKGYQALRIAVNSELENLVELLEWVESYLAEGKGMLAIITFHSLEQSRVVRFCKSKSLNLEIIKPTAAETKANPRSRSAILNLVTKN